MGQGLLLYLHVEDLDAAWERAQAMGVNVEEPPHDNPNSGARQFCLRDPEGYYLTIKQAHPDFLGSQ